MPKFVVGPIRTALSALWWLNIKVIPTAVLWGVAIFTTLETRNFLLRALGICAAFVAASIGSSIAISASFSHISSDLRSFYRDKNSFVLVLFTGAVVLISLRNVDRFRNSLAPVRIFMVANSITALVIFATVTVIFIPFQMTLKRGDNTGSQLSVFFQFIKKNKRPNFISVMILLAGWPLFFFYIFLALPFSQLLTKAALDEFLLNGTPSKVNPVHG